MKRSLNGGELRRRPYFGMALAGVLLMAAGNSVSATAPVHVPTTAPDDFRSDAQAILDAALRPDEIDWNCCGVDAPATGISAIVRVPGHDDLLLASGENLDGTPFDPHQTFIAGSLSLSVVQTLAWQLIDEGVLDPAATVDRWRSDLPNARVVTVEDLLQGTHGWPNYGDLTPIIFADPDHRFSWDEILLVIAALTPVAAPGTFSSDGSAPAATALLFIVEQASGSAFTDLVATRISERLQLDHTTVFVGDPEPAGLEDGIFTLGGAAEQVSAVPHNAFRTFHLATDGMNSTVEDVADLIDAWASGALFTTPRSHA